MLGGGGVLFVSVVVLVSGVFRLVLLVLELGTVLIFVLVLVPVLYVDVSLLPPCGLQPITANATAAQRISNDFFIIKSLSFVPLFLDTCLVSKVN